MIAVVIGIFFLMLAETIIKLFLNLIAVKAVSAIYKKTDKKIFAKTFTRAFLFSYFKILSKSDLRRKQMLLSALIITLITAPYYFLIRIIF